MKRPAKLIQQKMSKFIMNDGKLLSSYFFLKKNEHPFISIKDHQRTLSLNLPHLPLKKVLINKKCTQVTCILSVPCC